MATNKLMEAAADILAGSKKSAPAMPPEKLPGADAVDLGGPTPQNSKPDDDSNKIDATKAAKSATAPTTKPSAASGDKQDTMKKMAEEEEKDDEVIAEEESLEETSQMKKEEMCVLIDSIETRNEVIRILEKDRVVMSQLFKRTTDLCYLHFDKMWFFSNKFLNKKQITTCELENILIAEK
jgi:hypothetical protein